MEVARTVELKVHVAFDDAERIWYVRQSDVPGLRLEADALYELIRKIEDVAPDLIALNADEILAAQGLGSLPMPAVTIRPIFDTPLAIAS